MKTYRDLIVWQKAMALVTEIYMVSKLFPRREDYGVTSQLRRLQNESRKTEEGGRGRE
ncbi:MAG: four helix bundle protein [Desulfatiglandales bacterium]